ncbi:hypothetical protein [Roseovarius sp. SYSU LYC5161]|uniref:hypothetical protein n=1 Tax=Roseovarius halophilus (ex Wu et al. 2025) TaxID=3376060 RepID=UPI003999CF97
MADAQDDPLAILLLHEGEPIDVLGHAPKRRAGHLKRALARAAPRMAALAPDLVKTDPPVEYARGALIIGPFTICFDDARIAPPRRPEVPPKTSTERARAHRRRKRYGLTEIRLECPAETADRLRDLADAMVRQRKAEVDAAP